MSVSRGSMFDKSPMIDCITLYRFPYYSENHRNQPLKIITVTERIQMYR